MPGNAPSYLRPGAVDRIFGRTLSFLVRIGVVRGHFYVLEVRGRYSGKMISLPVDPLELGGKLYLVCARGDSNWVRNARAAGEVVLARAMRRRRHRRDAADRAQGAAHGIPVGCQAAAALKRLSPQPWPGFPPAESQSLAGIRLSLLVGRCRHRFGQIRRAWGSGSVRRRVSSRRGTEPAPTVPRPKTSPYSAT